MPTLIDLAGFENQTNELQSELFRIVFYGRMPEGENLMELKR